MAKLKFSIHPLFFAFGLYFAFCGKVFSFIIFVLSAVLHEFGHFLASERYGYQLNRIMLMPYGAVVTGDLASLKYRDEIVIAFAGPLLNLLIVVFFVALWWVVPEIYSYTDMIVTSNLFICMINLIPCYPLDGGRILQATLAIYLPRKIATLISKIIGLVFCAVLVVLFVMSCFNELNLTLLFFSLFVITGIFSSTKKNRYVRICDGFLQKKFAHGAEVKRIAISENAKVWDVYRYMGEYAVELVLIDKEGRVSKTLSISEVQQIVESKSLYERII